MDTEAAQPTTTPAEIETKGDKVKFAINFKKQNFDVEFGQDNTLSELRQHIAKLTGVAPGLQKLMFKGMRRKRMLYFAPAPFYTCDPGMLKDDNKTLKELNIKDGIKIMLVGSTINEVLEASAPPPVQAQEKAGESMFVAQTCLLLSTTTVPWWHTLCEMDV
jgi:hypothetical protein